MTRSVQTRDAQGALARLIRDDLDAASPNNDIVSTSEATRLDPFVRRAEEAVRGDKPKYGRVKKDEVVDRAMTDAMAAWNDVNPRSNPRDHRTLAQDEIKALERRDPELGALTRRAYALARGGVDRTAAVRSAIEAQPGIGALLRRPSSFGTRIDARPGQPGRDAIPDAVRRAFDHFDATEQRDRGTASLKRFPLGGGDVFALYNTTDGDDGILELFDDRGAALASARFFGDTFDRWDTHFGEGRFFGVFGRHGHPQVEGYSEIDEQRANGQITREWRPDVAVRDIAVSRDGGRITGIRTNASLTPEQDEVFRAVVALAYERTTQHAAPPTGDFDMGRYGAVRIGTHHDAVVGQDFIVGDWADHDDASFTFYFQRDANGRLQIAREQSNG